MADTKRKGIRLQDFAHARENPGCTCDACKHVQNLVRDAAIVLSSKPTQEVRAHLTAVAAPTETPAPPTEAVSQPTDEELLARLRRRRHRR